MPVNPILPAPVDGLRQRLRYWLRQDPLHLLWPRQCLACGDAGLEGLDLCGPCNARLPWNRAACPGCALPVAAPPDGGDAPLCGRCLRSHAFARRRGTVDAVHAACLYTAPVDRLLLRFKFHRDLAAGALLAQLMAQAFAGRTPPAALVPVPLHRSRLRRRGYDQSLELARPLSRALQVPLWEGRLVRVRATGPQTQLTATQRRRNVRDAFALRPGPPLPAHVVLVDDVMTTGATLAAAAQALRRAGVDRVEAWVCARAV